MGGPWMSTPVEWARTLLGQHVMNGPAHVEWARPLNAAVDGPIDEWVLRSNVWAHAL